MKILKIRLSLNSSGKPWLQYLYYQGLPGIRGSLLAAVILTVALWNDVSNLNLVVWFCCYAIACGIGEAMVRAFHRAQASRRAGPSLGQKICCAGNRWRAALGGCRCLSVACGHIPSGLGNIRPGGHERRNNGSHTAMKGAYLPFILAVYIPLIGRFFYEGEPSPDYYGFPVGCVYGVLPGPPIGCRGRSLTRCD